MCYTYSGWLFMVPADPGILEKGFADVVVAAAAVV